MATEQKPAQSIIPYDVKRAEEIQKAAPGALSQAKEFDITSNDDYAASGSLLALVVERQKEVEKLFADPIKAANSVHKFLTGLRTTLMQPYVQADEIIQKRRKEWRRLQEQQRLAQEEVDRKAAKEQADSQAIEEARELEDAGETEAANIVLERAANAPPPVVTIQSSVPKQAGHVIRKSWAFNILNQDLLKREFMEPDEKKIRGIVTNLGKDAVSVVGVGSIEVYEEESESVRSKK